METPEVVVRQLKARKRHVCDACALQVERGETYLCETVRSAGVIVWRWRAHPECDAEIVRRLNVGLYSKDNAVPLHALHYGTVQVEDLSPEYAKWLTARRLQEGASTP